MAFLYDPPLSLLMDFFQEDGRHQGFSEEEILKAENRLGVSLPPVYRNYLRTYGRDPINFHFNQLQEPEEIQTSYRFVEDELRDRERDFSKTGEASASAGPYFKFRQLPRERWRELTDNYVLIWYENQGVWSAGYRFQDLLDGNPDPPVYGSVNDDYITYTKWADRTEPFLLEMLRQAAYGWHGSRRLTKAPEIQEALSGAGICFEEREGRSPEENRLRFCLSGDGEVLYAYSAGQDYQELCTAARRPVPHSAAPVLQRPGAPRYTPDGRRPCRLALLPYQIKDLGMDRPRPAGGIPLHPLIALLIEEQFGRTPSTAYDWGKDIARMKNLKVQLHYKTVREYQGDTAYLRPPEAIPPPPPYYFDLSSWSAIGRMTALQSLCIEQIDVEDPGLWPLLAGLPHLRNLRLRDVQVGDFSFLPACRALRSVSFYHTDFSDCRLLLNLPKLQEADLRFCPLEHREALEELSFQPLL